MEEEYYEEDFDLGEEAHEVPLEIIELYEILKFQEELEAQENENS